MSQTKTISHSVAIIAIQTQVFNAVTDWESQKKWILFTKVRVVNNESSKLNGKIEAFTGYGKLGFLDTMTITKWEPPHTCEVTHTGKFVKGSGLFEVKVNTGGSNFTWTEYFSLPSGIFGNLLWSLLWIPTKVGLIISMGRFSKYFAKKYNSKM